MEKKKRAHPWLEGVGRRTLKDIKTRPEPEEIYELITTPNIPLERARRFKIDYKRARAFYRGRDRALMSLLFMCVCRANEVLQLRRRQFHLDSDPDFIIIKDFLVSKRKEKTLRKHGQTLIDIVLPKRKSARLYPFTDLVLSHLLVFRGPQVFRIHDRTRVWQIVRGYTGLWPHWFRSMALSFWVNLIGSDTAVAKMYGVKNVQTISHYFKGEWKDHREILRS